MSRGISGISRTSSWEASNRRLQQTRPRSAVEAQRYPQTGDAACHIVERIGSSFLAVMGRPRAGEYAQDEFQGLSEAGIRRVVLLLEANEAGELRLEDEGRNCADFGIDFRSFPIPDRGVPTSPSELSRVACEIYHHFTGGDATVIHCRAGIGRSSVVATAVLLHCGHSVGEAIQAISAARGLDVPDREEPLKWLEQHQGKIGECHLGGTSCGYRPMILSCRQAAL